MFQNYEICRLEEHRELHQAAAEWFHKRWGVPEEAYRESMNACAAKEGAVPRWYVIMIGGRIAAGLGVIENDFHDRKDLTPNVCSIYVEEEWRCQGIAGMMLQFVCSDMHRLGIDTLYLLTDHVSFYERYGWEFLCMVQGDGEPEMSRMYVHRMRTETKEGA